MTRPSLEKLANCLAWFLLGVIIGYLLWSGVVAVLSP